MTASDDVSDREIDLATSDESVEELLSSGADIDELIAAGVLDDYEPASQKDEAEEDEEIEFEPSTLTEEEARAWFNEWRQKMETIGYRRTSTRV